MEANRIVVILTKTVIWPRKLLPDLSNLLDLSNGNTGEEHEPSN